MSCIYENCNRKALYDNFTLCVIHKKNTYSSNYNPNVPNLNFVKCNSNDISLKSISTREENNYDVLETVSKYNPNDQPYKLTTIKDISLESSPLTVNSHRLEVVVENIHFPAQNLFTPLYRCVNCNKKDCIEEFQDKYCDYTVSVNSHKLRIEYDNGPHGLVYRCLKCDGLQNIKDFEKSVCKNKKTETVNSHELKFIGGSSNGRSDGRLATVYRCLNCDRMNYKEEFETMVCIKR